MTIDSPLTTGPRRAGGAGAWPRHLPWRRFWPSAFELALGEGWVNAGPELPEILGVSSSASETASLAVATLETATDPSDPNGHEERPSDESRRLPARAPRARRR